MLTTSVLCVCVSIILAAGLITLFMVKIWNAFNKKMDVFISETTKARLELILVKQALDKISDGVNE